MDRLRAILDALLLATLISFLGFGLVGTLDALDGSLLSEAMRAGLAYGLFGSGLAVVVTLLGAALLTLGRRRSDGGSLLGLSAGSCNVMLLACSYTVYWLQVSVLAGQPWYASTSLLASSAVAAAWGLLALIVFSRLHRVARPLERPRARRLVRTLALLAVLAGSSGLAAGPSMGVPAPREHGTREGNPNVIIVVLDAVRADFTSAHGYEKPTTPGLEKLSREGMQFMDAHSTASWTLPAVTSLLTSRVAGVDVKPGATGATSSGVALSEVLAEMGYSTLAISNNPHVFGPYGVGSRFHSTYDGRSGWAPPSTVARAITDRLFPVYDGELVDAASEAVAELPRPFFLYLHLMAGHAPYRLPSNYDSPLEVKRAPREIDFPTADLGITPGELESLISRYEASLRYADDQVARFLEALDETGITDSTLVLLTSDHGEEFRDHRDWLHGRTLYREVLHVPMLWRWPGRVPSHTSRSDVASLLDVPPTILGAVSADGATHLPPSWQGRDLEITRSEPNPASVSVVAELAPGLRALTTEQWKYIVDETSKEEWLFDRAADPGERTSLTSDRPAVLSEMRLELERHLGSADGALKPSAPQEVDPELVEKLRALGYVP